MRELFHIDEHRGRERITMRPRSEEDLIAAFDWAFQNGLEELCYPIAMNYFDARDLPGADHKSVLEAAWHDADALLEEHVSQLV